MSADEKRDLLCNVLAEAKALDLVVLGVREITVLADYFVVATATSSAHASAIGKSVREQMKRDHGLRCVPEGEQESNWIIMDFGEVVAHVMSQEMRDFYQLEKLWDKAARWRWEDDPDGGGGRLTGDGSGNGG